LIKSRNYFNIATANYFEGSYVIAYNKALKAIRTDISINNKFPLLLLAIGALYQMDIEDERKISSKLDNLLAKISNKDDICYIRTELEKINNVKNDKFYSQVLNKIQAKNAKLTNSQAI
jgi:hypothetical protein